MSNGAPQPTETENQRHSNWILFLALAGATVVAGYFIFRFYEGNKARVQLIEQTRIDSVRIADLDTKYTETLTSLNSYKGLNAQLDSIIKVRETELAKCRSEFLTMVRKNKITEEEYKKQLADLRNINTNFQNEIAQMQAENKLLRIEKDSLGRLVLAQNDSISALSESNAILSKKVTMGSLLRPTSISGTGIHTKNNGKDATTGKASKTDQLKVCFNLPVNEIADADTQVFFIRIISPDGSTLAGQNSTKSITLADTGEQIPYSIKSKVQYKNVATSSCVYFRQDVTYTKGTYTIEIYQHGHPVGTQKFALK